MTACTLTSLGRFEVFLFLSGCVVFYKSASTQKKSYYVSHIQVWTPSDGQSSHWCRGVSKASPTFSKKSMIHAVVNVFWWVFFSSVFWLTYSPWLLCSSSLLSLLTGACCSFHATQFFKCYHSIVDPGILSCNLALILTQPDLYFSQKIHLSRTMQYIL